MSNPETSRVCPRCEERHGVDDFRGSVCGWCADDLQDAVSQWPVVDYEPWLDEPDHHDEERDQDDRQAG